MVIWLKIFLPKYLNVEDSPNKTSTGKQQENDRTDPCLEYSRYHLPLF